MRTFLALIFIVFTLFPDSQITTGNSSCESNESTPVTTPKVTEIARLRGGQDILWLPDDEFVVYSNDLLSIYHDFDKSPQEFSINASGVRLAANRSGEVLAIPSFSEGSPGVVIWDTVHQKEITTLEIQYVYDVAFSPVDNVLVTAGQELYLWDTTTWKQIVLIKTYDPVIENIVFSPDGKFLVIGGPMGVKMWDMSNINKPQPLYLPEILDTQDYVTSVAISPDGNLLAFSNILAVNLYSLDNFQNIELPESDINLSRNLDFSPDGRFLIAASSSLVDNTVRMWDLEHQTHLFSLVYEDSRPVNRVAFNSCGDLFAAMSRDTTIIWKFED